MIPLSPLAAGFHRFTSVFPHQHFFPGISFESLDQRADLFTKRGEAGAAGRGAREVSFGGLPRGIPTSQPRHHPCEPAQVAWGFWRHRSTNSQVSSRAAPGGREKPAEVAVFSASLHLAFPRQFTYPATDFTFHTLTWRPVCWK